MTVSAGAFIIRESGDVCANVTIWRVSRDDLVVTDLTQQCVKAKGKPLNGQDQQQNGHYELSNLIEHPASLSGAAHDFGTLLCNSQVRVKSKKSATCSKQDCDRGGAVFVPDTSAKRRCFNDRADGGLYLVYEAIARFSSPEPVAGWIVVIVAEIVLAVDVATALLTYSKSKLLVRRPRSAIAICLWPARARPYSRAAKWHKSFRGHNTSNFR